MARRMGAVRRRGDGFEVLSGRGALVATCSSFDPRREMVFTDGAGRAVWRVAPHEGSWDVADGHGTELGRITPSQQGLRLQPAGPGDPAELIVRRGRRRGTWAELEMDRSVARVRRSVSRVGTDRVTGSGTTPDGRLVLTAVALLRAD